MRYTLLLWALLSCLPVQAEGVDSAVILLYHHVSEKTPAATSVTPAVFETHLQHLAENYQVLPLERAVEAVRRGEPLPDRSVAITFDDGYRNIFDNAHPLLVKYGLPYTVFVNPPMIGQHAYQLTWEQMRTMEEGGARFANHTARHLHLLQREPGETREEWLARLKTDFLQSEEILEKQLGYSLRYLAYPYGEFNPDVQQLLRQMEFTGFGQHSGGIWSGSDFTALPRFPAAGIYANMATLKVKMASLAMPVMDNSVTDPVVSRNAEPAEFSFSVDKGDIRVSQVGCFFAGESIPVAVEAGRISVSMPVALPTGRSRVNCTAPSVSKRGRYYWYSQPWFLPRVDGSYPD